MVNDICYSTNPIMGFKAMLIQCNTIILVKNLYIVFLISVISPVKLGLDRKVISRKLEIVLKPAGGLENT